MSQSPELTLMERQILLHGRGATDMAPSPTSFRVMSLLCETQAFPFTALHSKRHQRPWAVEISPVLRISIIYGIHCCLPELQWSFLKCQFKALKLLSAKFTHNPDEELISHSECPQLQQGEDAAAGPAPAAVLHSWELLMGAGAGSMSAFPYHITLISVLIDAPTNGHCMAMMR